MFTTGYIQVFSVKQESSEVLNPRRDSAVLSVLLFHFQSLFTSFTCSSAYSLLPMPLQSLL